MRARNRLYVLALAGIFGFVCGLLYSFGMAVIFNISVSPAGAGIAFAVLLWVGMIVAWAFDKTA